MAAKDSKSVEVSVSFGSEVVKLQLCPEDFSFSDFDCWLKARFAINSDEKVYFKDEAGKECMPTRHFFLKNSKLSVEKVSVAPKAAAAPVHQVDKKGLIQSHIPASIVVIAVLVYFFQHSGLVPYLASIESLCVAAGYFLKKEVMLEAMINGLGWAIMHLFIRRMMNPENGNYKWFDGYFLDSCYGGFAAAGQTLFKGFFLAMLLSRKN